MSDIQTAQDVFDLLKSPVPSCHVLKFRDNLSSRNQDMAQNIILQGHDLEESRSFVKVKKFLIRPPPLTNKYTCEVS